MWDQETLRRMNEAEVRQARLDYLEQLEQQKKEPLEFLARMLKRAAPPSLPALVGYLRDYEEYEEFIRLVKEFLPEYEREILRQDTPSSQMAAFASRFEDRYFPLEATLKSGDAEEYMQLTGRIPAVLMGMSYDDYEIITSEGRSGMQLLTYLFETGFIDTGERVSLAEACGQHVPRELLDLVPEGGFSCSLAHQLLDKTRYEPAALWADYINQNTGNFFLDTDYEMFSAGTGPEWVRAEVEALTPLWQQAELHNEETNSFTEWLEKDLPANFKELLEFMLERRNQDGVNREPNGRAEGLPVAPAGEPGDSAG